MPAATGKSGNKGGKGGSASPAALHDDEDLMARRGKHFRSWVASHRKKKPNTTAGKGAAMSYPNSGMPLAR